MELLITIAVIGLLAVFVFFTVRTQIAKTRDGRRKSDLAKIQKALEDYMNDTGCYLDNLNCGMNFSPYLSTIPCDPINNTYYNYFYSYNNSEACKSWYKIYTKLENIKDPIIEKVGCASGCGPSKNYNYWVASPNMNKVNQTTDELWWPQLPGVTPPAPPPSTSTPTSISTSTPAVTSPTPTSSSIVTSTPTSVTSSPVQVSPSLRYYGCFSGVCKLLTGQECSPKYIFNSPCSGDECCFYQCSNPNNECR